jgi:hypothetical protein
VRRFSDSSRNSSKHLSQIGACRRILVMRFTPLTARENAAKALASRKANYLAAKATKNGQSLQPPSTSVLAAETPATDEFSRARLARVRAQLNRIDDLLEAEVDPQRLDKLASAQSRLAEQERQLAGRPLPGSLRPTAEKRPGLFSRTEQTPPPKPSQAPSSTPFEQE